MEEDRSLSFNVYRKPTHTNQYLNFDSNHHVGHKLSVVKTMNLRAETLITKEENITSEKELLANAFRDCKLTNKLPHLCQGGGLAASCYILGL